MTRVGFATQATNVTAHPRITLEGIGRRSDARDAPIAFANTGTTLAATTGGAPTPALTAARSTTVWQFTAITSTTATTFGDTSR